MGVVGGWVGVVGRGMGEEGGEERGEQGERVRERTKSHEESDGHSRGEKKRAALFARVTAGQEGLYAIWKQDEAATRSLRQILSIRYRASGKMSGSPITTARKTGLP